MYLIYDTETNGLPQYYKAPSTETDNWPKMVSIAYMVCSEDGEKLFQGYFEIKPTWSKSDHDLVAQRTHGLSYEHLMQNGVDVKEVISRIIPHLYYCQYHIGHNLNYDSNILACEMFRNNTLGVANKTTHYICTMQASTDYCKIPNPKYKGYKWPKLTELYDKLFMEEVEDAHNALADVKATQRCFFELKARNIILFNKQGKPFYK